MSKEKKIVKVKKKIVKEPLTDAQIAILERRRVQNEHPCPNCQLVCNIQYCFQRMRKYNPQSSFAPFLKQQPCFRCEYNYSLRDMDSEIEEYKPYEPSLCMDCTYFNPNIKHSNFTERDPAFTNAAAPVAKKH